MYSSLQKWPQQMVQADILPQVVNQVVSLDT
jgi:hypothetical protein